MRIWIHKEALEGGLLGGSVLTEPPEEKFSERYRVFEEEPVRPDGSWLVDELNAACAWQDYLVDLNAAGYFGHTLKTNPGCEPLYELEVPRAGYVMAYLKANDSTPWVYIGYGVKD